MESFWEYIRSKKATGNEEKVMEILWYMAYSPYYTIGQLDFDRYSIRDFQMALEDLYYYQSDETLDVDDLEYPNTSTFIYDLNRLTHAGKVARKLTRMKKRKRRFV